MGSLRRNRYIQTEEENLEENLEKAIYHVKKAAAQAELAWDGWGSVTTRATQLMITMKSLVNEFVLVPPTYSQRGKSYKYYYTNKYEKK